MKYERKGKKQNVRNVDMCGENVRKRIFHKACKGIVVRKVDNKGKVKVKKWKKYCSVERKKQGEHEFSQSTTE